MFLLKLFMNFNYYHFLIFLIIYCDLIAENLTTQVGMTGLLERSQYAGNMLDISTCMLRCGQPHPCSRFQ